ncbi:unnamed protein product [Camellia sinensis]
MLLQLELECLDVYKRKVDQAAKSKARLLKGLADANVELSSLLSALGEKSFVGIPEKSTGTINEQLTAIAPVLEQLSLKKLDEFQSRLQGGPVVDLERWWLSSDQSRLEAVARLPGTDMRCADRVLNHHCCRRVKGTCMGLVLEEFIIFIGSDLFFRITLGTLSEAKISQQTNSTASTTACWRSTAQSVFKAQTNMDLNLLTNRGSTEDLSGSSLSTDRSIAILYQMMEEDDGIPTQWLTSSVLCESGIVERDLQGQKPTTDEQDKLAQLSLGNFSGNTSQPLPRHPDHEETYNHEVLPSPPCKRVELSSSEGKGRT